MIELTYNRVDALTLKGRQGQCSGFLGDIVLAVKLAGGATNHTIFDIPGSSSKELDIQIF